MPPKRSGVADYSAGLLAELQRRADVRLVGGAASEIREAGFDNAIYQVGNNPLHLPAYRAALAWPGVTVLHDAVLHHLLLGALGERAYIEEFVYNYGEWLRELAQELWRSRSLSAADARYFAYPLLRRIVESSRSVVVHNPRAARLAREAAPGAQIVKIPHYFVPPRLPGRASSTRDRLGIAWDEMVLGVFGYLRDSKRISSVLEAMPALRRGRLLLAGDFVSSDLELALASRLQASNIVRVGHVPEREFWRLAEITDVCVNLRYPAAGETSGIGIKMMGIGKPVVVTESEETSDLPELAVIRVDPGEAEMEMLAYYLRALEADKEMRAEIGRRAAEHIAARHTLERAAEMYLDVARVTAANRPAEAAARAG